jgi:integrase
MNTEEEREQHQACNIRDRSDAAVAGHQCSQTGDGLQDDAVDGGKAYGYPLLLDQGALRITQSVWHEKIQTVKSVKGNRLCEISPRLVEHLRQYIRLWRPNQLGLLFATQNGTPFDTDVLRKRKLYPLLDKLGIPRCGFHAFRHGNAAAMDQESVPMAVRQTRLGHSDARTTMLYSHVVSEDGKRFAARLGELLTEPQTIPVLSARGNA